MNKPKPLSLRTSCIKKTNIKGFRGFEVIDVGGIKFICETMIKQRIKSACEFYLEWCNNPKTFIIWYEDKRKVNELIKFMEHWFGEYWQDKFDSLEDKRIKIILRYNDWLFKLAFKEVLKNEE